MADITIGERFKKRYSKKSPEMRQAIEECLRQLARNPRHPGLRVHRMLGRPGVWEAYVDRANRVTFEQDGDAIFMRNNCNHDMLTRDP